MRVNSNRGLLLDTHTTCISPWWDERLAHRVSQLGSPPLLAVAMISLSAHTVGTPAAWSWTVVYILLAVLAPLLYLFWLVRRGEVTDLDVQLREQRTRPLLVSIAGAAAAWLALSLGAAPRLLVVVAGATCIQMMLILGITLRWKISVHCAAAVGLAVLAWGLVGRAAAPLVIGVPLIAWSRVRLRRHTVAQAIAGALLGLTVFSTLLSLTRGG
jgi:membrane-associated phospholipid phosphatase